MFRCHVHWFISVVGTGLFGGFVTVTGVTGALGVVLTLSVGLVLTNIAVRDPTSVPVKIVNA